MSRLRIFAVMFFAVFAFGVVMAASASAEVYCLKFAEGLWAERVNGECLVELAIDDSEFEKFEFLLAEWLLEGLAITTADSVEIPGELNLINLNGGGLGVVIEILCSWILDGTVGPASAGLITELLNLGKEAISGTALSGLELVCTNTKNCENPRIWLVKFPWETELELLQWGLGFIYIDLVLNPEFTMECTVLGVKIEETCLAPEVAVEATNETGGVVDVIFSDSIQELANLKLSECGGRMETFEHIGLITIFPVGGGSLTVSSE